MNLGTYLEQAVSKFSERPLFHFYEQTLTYAEFGQRVNALAHGLQGLGFRRGEVIHVLLQNHPDVMVAYCAIHKIGAIAGPINTLWKPEEVAYLLGDSGGRGLIVEAALLPVIQQIRARCPGLQVVVEHGAAPQPEHVSFEALVAEAGSAPFSCPAAPQVIAYNFYTSGTTGEPKGVLLSHRNILSDVAGLHQALNLGEGMSFLCFLPLFHVNAMMSCTSSLGRGNTVVLRRGFSKSEFWEVVERYRVNYWSAVPTVYNVLLTEAGHKGRDLSSLRFAVSGAAPLTPATMDRFQKTFGIPIVEGYGLTEASCVSTLNPREGVRKPGSIGLPLPGQQVKVVDPQGQECPAGVPGEIVIGGEVVMAGYHRRPEETSQAVRQGLLHTGDVAYRDEDGYLFIVDRLKDLVIRGGENIYPKEIDNLLASHPKIIEAAAIGVPDPIRGEELKVFVRASDSSLTEQQVLDFCAEHLAEYKVPKYVEILKEDFPRNAVGKILKRELKRRSLAATPAPAAAAPAAPSPPALSAEAIFQGFPSRVVAANVAGVNARLGYRLSGPGGGEWTLEIKEGQVKVLAGLQSPQVTSSFETQDFIDLTTGKLDGMTAFNTGKLKVEGDLGLLARSAKFFRKFTAATDLEPRAAQKPPLLVRRQLLSIPQRFTTGPQLGRFLKELRDNRRITGNRCPSCHRIQTPPREICAVCRVRVEELLEIGPEGCVQSFDVTYYSSPDPLTGVSRETPYCTAFLRLDGCGEFDVFWHEINPADIPKLRRGSRVRPVWAEQRTGAITDIRHFEVID